MAGRPKSQAEKAAFTKREHDALMARTVNAYLAELQKPDHRSRRGLRTICQDFQQLYFDEKGVLIPLSFVTLARLSDGGHTREEANEHRRWLTVIEEDIIVTFVIEMGTRGFPLSHRRIKEHVDRIARARLGDKFPANGVGKNWTARFMLQHSDQLKMTDSRPLEDKRGRAVNPHANRFYWKDLEWQIVQYCIKEETTFGSDEIGVLARGAERECVATSRKNKGPQYQLRAGTRENTTVIVTICADGTAIPPTVIFKGAAYQVRWGDDNPLNASIGYQKKGWTCGEIGAEWIKIFDAQTKDKVKDGEYRLLLVDGHNSHHTVDFLLYAREHRIIVFCYIPHSTHIFQGLDVVIFSPLKKYIGEERDIWLREKGTAMDKTNFLAIYARAHVRALTVDNIKSAFRKTGIWPFNPNVVTAEMLAPSKETSSEAHLPLPPNDPEVNMLATMFRKLATIQEAEHEAAHEDLPSDDTSESKAPIANLTKHDVINEAIDGLSRTKLAHLISSTLTTSNDAMPSTFTQTITRSKPSPLLAIKPQTETEILLLAALQEAQNHNDSLINRNIALQANNLLNEVYCGNAKGALQFQENKKKKKVTGTLPDGMARVLTSDDFYKARVDFENGQKTEAREKETRKDARAEWKAAKREWQRIEDECLVLKDREDTIYKERKAAWDAENTRAKRGRGRGRGRGGGTVQAKPKRGPIPKRVPPPLLRDFLAGNNRGLGEAEAEADDQSSNGEFGSSNSEGNDDEDDDDDDDDAE